MRAPSVSRQSPNSFLKVLAWFVKDVGLPGYFGLGTSKEEVDPNNADISRLRSIAGRFLFVYYNFGVAMNDLSLEATKALIEMFPLVDTKVLKNLLREYLFEYWMCDPHPERSDKFKIIVETLVAGSHEYKCTAWTRADDGSCLVGHFLLWSLLDLPNEDSDEQLFLLVKEYQPDVFLLQNDDGRTMLDFMLSRSLPHYYSYDIFVLLFLQEGPEAC